MIAATLKRTVADRTTPPGLSASRGMSDENFPVASRLLSRRVRARILAFYIFARMADDVADDPAGDAPAKLAALDWFEAGLTGDPGLPEAQTLRATLGNDAHALEQARALLGAFRQDVRGHTYATWADLHRYCTMSAQPVGRFLLAIHDEDRTAERLSDPLCVALQVLNHLQDIKADRRSLGRVYLPAAWLHEAGADADDLSRDSATPALRRVIDLALDECDALLGSAGPLPAALRDPGLRAQADATLSLARRLSRRLRQQDPLAGRVALTRLDFAGAGARALYRRVIRA